MRERFNKYRYDAKKRSDNNEIHQNANVYQQGGRGLCQCKCSNIYIYFDSVPNP